MKFEALPPRGVFLTDQHAAAFIAEAHRQGRWSMALTQALQFELSFRLPGTIREKRLSALAL
jgi:hypothetical protein